ncbi:MAG: hypothetical protein DMG65_10125 [Candidatus Angelobacter sp. Gp1-AA117]|nr:MAG: hypothetical protein DMG65_10125 [Candidatus Angelobacter sp. Gp1-AA117]
MAVSSIDPTGVHIYATFHWTTLYSSGYTWYSFTGLAANAAPTAPLNVIDRCTYANGISYHFSYGDWGLVSRIDHLSSTGLTRNYVSYNFPLANQGALSDAPAYTTETVFDDASTVSWNYSTSKAATGVVTSMAISDPAGNTSTTTLDSSTGLLSSVQLKDSNNKVWSTTSYTWKSSGNSTVPDTIITTNDAGQQSKKQYSYDSYGNVTDLAEYDFGLALLRHTITTYLVNDPSGSGYLGKHILNLPMEVQIKDAAGTIKARTGFTYDSTGFYNTTDINANGHDNTHYGVGSPNTNIRGNLTAVTRYADPVTPSGGILRTFIFDSLGNLRKANVDC